MATVELVAYTEIDELAEAIRRDGFAYMPGVLNGEEISTLREQIEPTQQVARRKADQHPKDAAQQRRCDTDRQ